MTAFKPAARYLPTLTEIVRPPEDQPQTNVCAIPPEIATVRADAYDMQQALEAFEIRVHDAFQAALQQALERVTRELHDQLEQIITAEAISLRAELSITERESGGADLEKGEKIKVES